jgi:hypothetical protein
LQGESIVPTNGVEARAGGSLAQEET